MTRFKIFRTAAILSLMFATPAFAQAAIQEPGAFAFYYPNNDVLNGGRPTPAAGMDTRTLMLFNNRAAYAAMDSRANGASCAQRHRSHDPASGTLFGYDGRQHKCQ
jgi:BA14K-like protein